MGYEFAVVFAGAGELARLRAAYPDHPLLEMERGRPLREILGDAQVPTGMDNPDPNYHTWSEINADLLAFEQNFPAIARRVDLTLAYGAPKTHGNRDIFALKISDNPQFDEDEPAILVVGNHHARELNTIELALDVASRVLSAYGTDPQLTQLVDENVLWILPTMNPDGLEHVWNVDNFWRKNRRNNGNGIWGVDLNRNYPFFWAQCGSSGNTGSNTYHGPGAGSEPETQTMMAFGMAERFERTWDQHSYGRDVRWAHNPLTVGSIPAPVKSILDPLQAQIAQDMFYSVASSCCCGGNQHWHFATWGSLAYLGELGTAFQPVFSSTVSELTRVWPGIRRFLTTPVPVRGHVTSLAGGGPVAAQITLPAAPFLHGQKRLAEPRFGRYSVWLGPATHTLRFSAPGFVTQDVQVTLVQGQTTVEEVVLIPALVPTILTATGIPSIGATVVLSLSSPGDPGRDYMIGVSDAITPEIQVGPRTIPLAHSPLLASVLLTPQIFANFTGMLDGSGFGQGQLHIPNLGALIGFQAHFAAVTFDTSWPLAIKGISNRVSLTVQ